MDKLSQCLGMTVLRPLLDLRKNAMYEYAAAAALPYMADSTPLWSRRGWTRRVLDSITGAARAALEMHLLQLGAASEDLAAQIADGFDKSRVPAVLGKLGASDGAGAGAGAGAVSGTVGHDDHGHQVAFLDFENVEDFIASLKDDVDQLMATVKLVADVWNAAIADQVKGGDGGDGGDGCAAGVTPVVCPLQPIKFHLPGNFSSESYLFALAVKDGLRKPGINSFLRGGQVAGKALAHLRRSLKGRRSDGAKEVWGSFHQRCPFVWLQKPSGLLLFPIECHDLRTDAPHRRAFLARCRVALWPQHVTGQNK